MLLGAMLVRPRTQDTSDGRISSCGLCYAMAIVINAAFDVTLEGPMQGIWFWCLFGFGIGSVMVYRAQAADGLPTELGARADMSRN